MVHVAKRDSDNPARIYTNPTTPFISSTATGWLWSNTIRTAYGTRPTGTHFEQPVDDRSRKHAGCNNVCTSGTHDASTSPTGTLRCPSSHTIGTRNTGLTSRTLDPTTYPTTASTTTTTTHSLYVSTSLTLSCSGHCYYPHTHPCIHSTTTTTSTTTATTTATTGEFHIPHHLDSNNSYTATVYHSYAGCIASTSICNTTTATSNTTTATTTASSSTKPPPAACPTTTCPRRRTGSCNRGHICCRNN